MPKIATVTIACCAVMTLLLFAAIAFLPSIGPFGPETYKGFF